MTAWLRVEWYLRKPNAVHSAVPQPQRDQAGLPVTSSFPHLCGCLCYDAASKLEVRLLS